MPSFSLSASNPIGGKQNRVLVLVRPRKPGAKGPTWRVDTTLGKRGFGGESCGSNPPPIRTMTKADRAGRNPGQQRHCRGGVQLEGSHEPFPGSCRPSYNLQTSIATMTSRRHQGSIRPWGSSPQTPLWVLRCRRVLPQGLACALLRPGGTQRCDFRGGFPQQPCLATRSCQRSSPRRRRTGYQPGWGCRSRG